jgi:uncharacterized protein (DUF4415 family)
MAAKQLMGVGGVLGSLLSPSPVQSTTPEPEDKPPVNVAQTPHQEPLSPPAVVDTATKSHPASSGRTQARRGRPPGKKAGDAADKEKVTLRLSKKLMDEYREWSWEERCQLGELVERALIRYRKNRR